MAVVASNICAFVVVIVVSMTANAQAGYYHGSSSSGLSHSQPSHYGSGYSNPYPPVPSAPYVAHTNQLATSQTATVGQSPQYSSVPLPITQSALYAQNVHHTPVAPHANSHSNYYNSNQNAPLSSSVHYASSESVPSTNSQSVQYAYSQGSPLPTRQNVVYTSSQTASLPSSQSVDYASSQSVPTTNSQNVHYASSQTVPLPSSPSIKYAPSQSAPLTSSQSVHYPSSYSAPLPSSQSINYAHSHSAVLPNSQSGHYATPSHSGRLPSSQSINYASSQGIALPSSPSVHYSTSQSTSSSQNGFLPSIPISGNQNIQYATNPINSYTTAQSSYAPTQSSYAPTQSSYVPTQTSYTPTQNSYAPTRSSYAPTQSSHAPTQSSYAPSQSSYVPTENNPSISQSSYTASQNSPYTTSQVSYATNSQGISQSENQVASQDIGQNTYSAPPSTSQSASHQRLTGSAPVVSQQGDNYEIVHHDIESNGHQTSSYSGNPITSTTQTVTQSGAINLDQPYSSDYVAHYPAPAPVVTKHIYFHAPPPEVEERPVQLVPPTPPKKIFNIVFIKVPSQESRGINGANLQAVASQRPQIEDKTLIYVLVKKPEPQPQPQPLPVNSEHEVFYVKYKGDANEVANQIHGKLSQQTPLQSDVTSAIEPILQATRPDGSLHSAVQQPYPGLQSGL